jgi:hypothetical protein
VPSTQETVKAGVLLFVVLSVFDDPVSVPAVMSGVPVAAGAVESMVTEREDELTDAFPAASLCFAVIRYTPSVLRVEEVTSTVDDAQVPVPSVVDPESTVTVSPVSHEMVKVGVVSLVMSSVLEDPKSDAVVKSGVPGAEGAEVSMVTESPEEATEVLPAVSLCVAVMLCTPSLRVPAVSVALPPLHVPLDPVATVSL